MSTEFSVKDFKKKNLANVHLQEQEPQQNFRQAKVNQLKIFGQIA